MRLKISPFAVVLLLGLSTFAESPSDERSVVRELVILARSWQRKELLADTPTAEQMRVAHSNFVALLHTPLVQDQRIRRFVEQHSETNTPGYWVLAVTQADAYWAWGKTNEAFRIWQSFTSALPQLEKH